MDYFSIDTKISEIKEFNKGLTRVKINVAYDGLNRKNMIIPDNVIEDSFSTARGIPIVAHFLQDDKTIVGHEGDRGIINNRYTVSGKTYAYGFTDQNVMPYWEEKDGKKWICMIGYLFTDRFPESKNIVDSFQSMEVRLKMSDDKKDGHLLVDKMEFLALCSLNQDGKIPPTFENSKFVKFSEGEDADEYYEKVKDLVDEDDFLKPSERVRYNKIKTFDDMIKWLETNGIIQISDEDKGEISEDYEFAVLEKYQHINFKPPISVAKEAKRGLELREKQPDSNKCCTPVGLARARQLVNRQELSPSTIKRMKAYFDRHDVDKQGEGWGEDSKGYQAWLHWGGDAGYTWAKKIVAQMDKADEKFSFSDKADSLGEQDLSKIGVNDTDTPKEFKSEVFSNMKKLEQEVMSGMNEKYGCGKYSFVKHDEEKMEMYALDMETGKPVVMKYVLEDDEMKPVEDTMSDEISEDMDTEDLLKVVKNVYDMLMNKHQGYMALESEKAKLEEEMSLMKASIENGEKEKAEFAEKLSELELLKKQNSAKEILDHSDFSLLTNDEKSSLLSKVTKETDTDSFKMMAEAFSFQKVKNGNTDVNKFSIALTNDKTKENDLEADIYQSIKKEYNFK